MVHGSNSKKKLQIRKMEVLWKTKREIVETEITRMIEEDGRTGTRFELRTSASKTIINNMNQQDLKDLKAAGEKMARSGYSEEHKRRSVRNIHLLPRPAPSRERAQYHNENFNKSQINILPRLAKRYHKKRVMDTMENQYQEMGMTSIVFVCYKDSDGKPVVNMYATNLSSFIDTYFN